MDELDKLKSQTRQMEFEFESRGNQQVQWVPPGQSKRAKQVRGTTWLSAAKPCNTED
jgi:hypothetical protein